ncbi:unnamed protein product [marine sediment metagenome]|uniref:Uncharacterized protein n=1 Tax=marine sediment metagenome TaxID=412755 RepID=X1IPN8_9ZZZZ
MDKDYFFYGLAFLFTKSSFKTSPIIRHTARKKNCRFNASSFLKQLKEDKNYLHRIPKKSIILSVLNDIKSIIPLIIFKTKVE